MIRVFDIVSVMVMLFLGRRSFSGRLRFFREGFKFYGVVIEMLSEVFGNFSGRVGIISVVLSLFRGFERFLGGGDIFRVINFYFHVHGKIEAF